MSAQLAPVLGVLYALSEAGLALFKRSGKSAADADKGSLGLIWTVILASACAAFVLQQALPRLDFAPARRAAAAGVPIFAAGIALRWYAIVHLGRFFTVNVAIAADHRLIDNGPYRLLRHPSYTGALLAFCGLGVCLRNGAALAVLVIPVLVVFLRRMRIEEEALLAAFGEPYRDYMRCTWRLIPFIY
jgi:protein-S-isoprenylcysteine O-methyltransferase